MALVAVVNEEGEKDKKTAGCFQSTGHNGKVIAVSYI